MTTIYKISCDHCDTEPQVEEWFDEKEGCWIRNCRGLSTRGYDAYYPDDEFFLEWFAHPNDYSGLRYWVNEAYFPAAKKPWRYKVALCRTCGAVNGLPVNDRWIGAALTFVAASSAIAVWYRSGSLLFAAFAACGASYVSVGLGTLIDARRLGAKAVPCAVCDATDYLSLRQAQGRRNLCPQCGRQSLRVHVRHEHYKMARRA